MNDMKADAKYDDVLKFSEQNSKYGKLLKEYGIPFTERTERVLMGFLIDITDLQRVADERGLTVEQLQAEIRSKI